MQTARSFAHAPARLLGGLGTAAFALLLLAACASSQPTRLHALAGAAPAAPAAPAAAYTGAALAVRSVGIPPTLDRTELVDERSGGEIRLREFDHWATPLARGARQALTESLALRLPPGKVVFPAAPRPAAAIEIDVDVLAFRVAGGTASMWLSWSLRPPRAAPSSAVAATPAGIPAAIPSATPAAGAVPPADAATGVAATAVTAATPFNDELRLQTQAGDSAAATAQAWTALLGQLADRIVSRLSTAPAR